MHRGQSFAFPEQLTYNEETFLQDFLVFASELLGNLEEIFVLSTTHIVMF